MKFNTVVPPPKLAVRRETACAMVECAKLIDDWITAGKLIPANPGERVAIYPVREIEALFASYTSEKRSAAY